MVDLIYFLEDLFDFGFACGGCVFFGCVLEQPGPTVRMGFARGSGRGYDLMDTRTSPPGPRIDPNPADREARPNQLARTPIRLVNRDGLVARGINYSRSHLWRLERELRFPRRVRLGNGRVAWIEAEVDEYLARLAAARGLAQA